MEKAGFETDVVVVAAAGEVDGQAEGPKTFEKSSGAGNHEVFRPDFPAAEGGKAGGPAVFQAGEKFSFILGAGERMASETGHVGRESVGLFHGVAPG